MTLWLYDFVADPDQFSELKRVWRTWIELSVKEGRWVTEMRKAAFEKDREIEEVMQNYLMAIPPNHRKSVCGTLRGYSHHSVKHRA